MLRVLVTDVDGVLTCINIWDFLHRCFGTKERAIVHERWYRSGLIDYVAWAKLDALLWRGRSWSEVLECVSKVPVRSGARELIEFARSRGLRVIGVSAGLDVVYHALARAGAAPDILVANRLRVCGGVVTGDVLVLVTDRNKGVVMEEVLKMLGYSCDEAVVIGDGVIDIPMLERGSVSIAFNPEGPEVEEVADYVVRGDHLWGVLDVLKNVLS